MQDLPSLVSEQYEPGIQLGKPNIISHQLKSLNENNIDHTKEVIIGPEKA